MSSSLTLTARLNTAAMDSRRGVVRLHPEVIAALGIREWDAVSLMGSRTTVAVVGVAPAGSPAGRDRPSRSLIWLAKMMTAIPAVNATVTG